LIVRIKSLPLRTSLGTFGMKKNAFFRFLVWQNRDTFLSNRGTIFTTSKTTKFWSKSWTNNIRFFNFHVFVHKIPIFNPFSILFLPTRPKHLDRSNYTWKHGFTTQSNLIQLIQNDLFTKVLKTIFDTKTRFSPKTFNQKQKLFIL